MKKLEEVGLVPLSKKECVEQFGRVSSSVFQFLVSKTM